MLFFKKGRKAMKQTKNKNTLLKQGLKYTCISITLALKQISHFDINIFVEKTSIQIMVSDLEIRQTIPGQEINR